MGRVEDLQRHLRRLTAKAKNWKAVLDYAESIRNGSKAACIELRVPVLDIY